jgi:hypothetical protein
MVPGLQDSGLDLDLAVSPQQTALPGLYRGHDAFLFTSRRVCVCVCVCMSGLRWLVCAGR